MSAPASSTSRTPSREPPDERKTADPPRVGPGPRRPFGVRQPVAAEPLAAVSLGVSAEVRRRRAAAHQRGPLSGQNGPPAAGALLPAPPTGHHPGPGRATGVPGDPGGRGGGGGR